MCRSVRPRSSGGPKPPRNVVRTDSMAQPSAGRSLSARRPAVLQTGVLSAGFVPSKARASARRAGASPWRRPATLRVRSLRKLRPDGFDPTGIGSPQPPLGRRPATLASTGASQAPSRRIDRTQCGSPQPSPGCGPLSCSHACPLGCVPIVASRFDQIHLLCPCLFVSLAAPKIRRLGIIKSMACFCSRLFVSLRMITQTSHS